VTYRHPESPT